MFEEKSARDGGMIEDRDKAYIRETGERLRVLCRKPTYYIDPKTKIAGGIISDEDIDEISACLRDLEEDVAAERPRTYAVLYMMSRTDLISMFKVAGLWDNSIPYPDRRSLPPIIRRDPEVSHQFLELQAHVMSSVCQMEKGPDSPHVFADSGDCFFERLGSLGKGGDA